MNSYVAIDMSVCDSWLMLDITVHLLLHKVWPCTKVSKPAGLPLGQYIGRDG